MIPIGYLYKRVAPSPEWLGAPGVKDIFSVSHCISSSFADYIKYWRHNGYWLFDAPAVMKTLAAEQLIPLDGLKLFYYEAYRFEFDEETQAWRGFAPEPSFALNVEPPRKKVLEGFDVVTFSSGNDPGCSPLSCNACAQNVQTNEHCLLPTFEEAKAALESGALTAAEPGPYRIIAVYSAKDD